MKREWKLDGLMLNYKPLLHLIFLGSQFLVSVVIVSQTFLFIDLFDIRQLVQFIDIAIWQRAGEETESVSLRPGARRDWYYKDMIVIDRL